MTDAWARESANGNGWSIAATLEKMGDEAARKWLEEILVLFTEVVEGQRAAEAYAQRNAIRNEPRAAELAWSDAKKDEAVTVFYKVCQLLEDHAPAWYPEQLRERAHEALQVLKRKTKGPIVFREVIRTR